MKRIILNIGDIVVCAEPSVLETVLGSCVSVCLWDETLKISGMNHFMVPHIMHGLNNPFYSGQKSIEKLIEDLIRTGANPPYIRAKVFGGGVVIKKHGEKLNVGLENVRIAREILKNHGIIITKEFVCPDYAIKVVFYTATGRVFVKKLTEVNVGVKQ